MKKRSLNLSGLFILTAVLLVGCANQLPPRGGPIDPTPPEIISIYPADGTLNFKGKSINIGFKHYVDERTLEESVFISPYVGALEFDWSGTEVEIMFSDSLRSNTTYVVNIGTDVQDKYRNNTRMAKAYTMAFSTGREIDRGGIEGRVFPRSQTEVSSGIMIFAYKLDGLNPDTLNPETTNPDFITQTGRDGDFFLYHIPFGDYRIFAIRDEYRNLVYDQGVDDYGVQSGILRITATDTLVSDVFMKLAREDLTGPILVKVMPTDKNHIIAEFSKSIKQGSVAPSSFNIVDTLNQNPLGVISAYLSPTSESSVIAVTNNQDSTKMYRLLVLSIMDSVGNNIQTKANSLLFQGSPIADTLKPKLASVSIRDSIQEIELQPTVTFVFSDALAKGTSLDFINLFDVKNRPIQLKKMKLSDVEIAVEPDKELASLNWYSLHADLNKIKDWTGRSCKDSIKIWRFQTLDVEELASIDGVVGDINRTDSEGRLYVSAVPVGEKKEKHYKTNVDAGGKFIFPQVREGLYMLQAFADRNENGNYDVGKPFPFIYSERLGRLSDTLKVRARWALEGVNIQMH